MVLLAYRRPSAPAGLAKTGDSVRQQSGSALTVPFAPGRLHGLAARALLRPGSTRTASPPRKSRFRRGASPARAAIDPPMLAGDDGFAASRGRCCRIASGPILFAMVLVKRLNISVVVIWGLDFVYCVPWLQLRSHVGSAGCRLLKGRYNLAAAVFDNVHFHFRLLHLVAVERPGPGLIG